MKVKINKFNVIKYCATVLTSAVVLVGVNNMNDSVPVNNTSYTYNNEEHKIKFIQSNFSDDDIKTLPSELEYLYLDYSNYLTDLSDLPEQCPNLKVLSLDNCPLISDLSFIEDLNHLQILFMKNNPYITEELINYLASNNITTNINFDDVKHSIETDNIVNDLITSDMSDEEKIKQITLYMIKNYSYDESLVDENNSDPLGIFLDQDKGVCAGYAYLSTVLLNKAGVESYNAISSKHAWVIVHTNNKYYYIDPTNLNFNVDIGNVFLDKFNTGIYYMTDPGLNFASMMDDYDSNHVVIPNSLIQDIKNSEDEKSIIEKYQGTFPTAVIKVALTFVAIVVGIDIIKAKKKTKEIQKNL